ncbi:Glucosamine 6-phosphate synthetase, contains amidotransferase and phosphosugar isomerase domain [Oceanicola granulosus HTCC2516]|uniref:Glutamine--fructose-6-phosphate aminotransferase [isomerizing] n=1 Tax=Oceanicola granulosus (strain ATCC BAA-861 / DSM 15982 / KCTC 12143 / HTCC2516) TaxID=314256 RepID=Q2CH82_OCEGH|nr:SIS domain-containing protein [Oceanicola granulosus]EAR51929.1 Glucosamine 6-phosphate synthetase, contains amidotransferase and phosphosugar isomerase domain [Oceanicola granulosus HTCC2516]
MENEKTVMLREIAMQPDFVVESVRPMLDAMRKSLEDREPGHLVHGYMIGCGDSYCAAIAARQYMMKVTGLTVEPVEALEFSHYLVEDLPANSFVFGISNSGTVSRTIEGVRRARERGAWTFGVTVSEDNKLAKAAETLIKVNATPNIKELGDGTRVVTPGSITYTASMLGLYTAAIAIGERLGNLDADAVEALVTELEAVGESMRQAEAPTRDLAREIAPSFTRDRHTVIVGGGPNYATAYFAMAKWFESLTRPAHLSQLEEWAHEHYFMTNETVDTFIILPPGRGRRRGLEQARAAREMGGRVIMIAAASDEEAAAAADVHFQMPDGVPEALTPFVYKLPFEHLGCEISRVQEIPFLGFHEPKRQQVNFRQIFESADFDADDMVAAK